MVGQADLKVNVSGSTLPEGKFITDRSMVSEEYAVVQDSEYYQWFSYEIASPIQQIQYKTFVEDITHPAGFALFSKLRIGDRVTSTLEQTDPIIDIT